jgi:hypothetical protein
MRVPVLLGMPDQMNVTYTDLVAGASKTEQFDDVDELHVVGNPDGQGDTLIIHHTDQAKNTVRNEIRFRSAS